MQFNTLLPELMVADLQNTLHFYRDILGFSVEYTRNTPPFAFISFQGSQFMFQELVVGEKETEKLEYPFGRGINFQIETDSVHVLVNALQKYKYPLHRGIKDSWYRENDVEHGCREILVLDPDGYLLRFSEDLGVRKAQV